MAVGRGRLASLIHLYARIAPLLLPIMKHSRPLLNKLSCWEIISCEEIRKWAAFRTESKTQRLSSGPSDERQRHEPTPACAATGPDAREWSLPRNGCCATGVCHEFACERYHCLLHVCHLHNACRKRTGDRCSPVREWRCLKTKHYPEKRLLLSASRDGSVIHVCEYLYYYYMAFWLTGGLQPRAANGLTGFSATVCASCHEIGT